ncbi:hypothetical protein PLEOSDRAFT_169732 [Pleurotus ostreatus PC15]|uniref:Uncharacterized protein n=1 Tax=Pleurotus ostreatus (strain PC15) TaxID=1137138 RepID=A0A067NFZ5_PLEO1|nr:hypothetical protein PLEOSDRAFT_169732 [Pleurotus ostreatus PC15]
MCSSRLDIQGRQLPTPVTILFHVVGALGMVKSRAFTSTATTSTGLLDSIWRSCRSAKCLVTLQRALPDSIGSYLYDEALPSPARVKDLSVSLSFDNRRRDRYLEAFLTEYLTSKGTIKNVAAPLVSHRHISAYHPSDRPIHGGHRMELPGISVLLHLGRHPPEHPPSPYSLLALEDAMAAPSPDALDCPRARVSGHVGGTPVVRRQPGKPYDGNEGEDCSYGPEYTASSCSWEDALYWSVRPHVVQSLIEDTSLNLRTHTPIGGHGDMIVILGPIRAVRKHAYQTNIEVACKPTSMEWMSVVFCSAKVSIESLRKPLGGFPELAELGGFPVKKPETHRWLWASTQNSLVASPPSSRLAALCCAFTAARMSLLCRRN